ncbi:MAG: hypothetical protein QOH12_1479 [Solirubrobacteraceae bacterium]|nr:hypothetical protein [Solirubrobacteraceae bacterium]
MPGGGRSGGEGRGGSRGLPPGGGWSEIQSGGGGHHRWAPAVDGSDDLLGVDALEVDAGRAQVGVSELALDDVERDAFPGEFYAWAWRSWCGAKWRRTAACVASRRNSTRTAALAHGRAAGRSVDDAERRADGQLNPVSQPGPQVLPPQASMPISRRRPPLPHRTSTEPRRGSRSCSVSASASWTRRPPRHSTTMIPRNRRPFLCRKEAQPGLARRPSRGQIGSLSTSDWIHGAAKESNLPARSDAPHRF